MKKHIPLLLLLLFFLTACSSSEINSGERIFFKVFLKILISVAVVCGGVIIIAILANLEAFITEIVTEVGAHLWQTTLLLAIAISLFVYWPICTTTQFTMSALILSFGIAIYFFIRNYKRLVQSEKGLDRQD